METGSSFVKSNEAWEKPFVLNFHQINLFADQTITKAEGETTWVAAKKTSHHLCQIQQMWGFPGVTPRKIRLGCRRPPSKAPFPLSVKKSAKLLKTTAFHLWLCATMKRGTTGCDVSRAASCSVYKSPLSQGFSGRRIVILCCIASHLVNSQRFISNRAEPPARQGYVRWLSVSLRLQRKRAN